MMRKLLNILAVIIGVVSACSAISFAVILVTTVTSAIMGTEPAPAGSALIYFLLFMGGGLFLSGLIASRALLHLRHPDAGTSRDMIGTAIFMIAISGILPLSTKLNAPSYVPLVVVIGLYVLHRWMIKRIATNAFPATIPESQP